MLSQEHTRVQKIQVKPVSGRTLGGESKENAKTGEVWRGCAEGGQAVEKTGEQGRRWGQAGDWQQKKGYSRRNWN